MKKLLVLWVSIALVTTACGGTSSSNTASSTPEGIPPEFAEKANPLGAGAAADGAKVFQSNCVACHGETGAGDGVASQSLDPKPANLAELSQQVGDDYLFWRISTGKPGTSMVAWKGILTDEQVWQVVTFIRTLK